MMMSTWSIRTCQAIPVVTARPLPCRYPVNLSTTTLTRSDPCAVNKQAHFSKGSDLWASSKSRLEVFPNPASNQLSVSWTDPDAEGDESTDILLINTLGQTVYHNRFTRQTGIQLEVGQYTPGLYLLQVKRGEYAETLKVILKENR